MLGELDEQQIDHLLHSELVGRIGCHADGRTYVVPVTYVYAGGAIYGHTHDGLKVRLMRANPQVCFEVDRMENMANWQSVIAWGTFQELQGEEASRGVELLLGRLLPLIISESSMPTQGTRSATTGRPVDISGRTGIVYRINLTEKTGRFEKR